MSAGSMSTGAVRMIGGGFSWAANNLIAAGLLLLAGFVAVHATPYAVMMLWYHDTPQVGVEKATNFVRSTWTIGGATYESRKVVASGFEKGQAMTEKSLTKAERADGQPAQG